MPFFTLCAEQLSAQPHYDFGLRALKSVLTSAGGLKRERIRVRREELAAAAGGEDKVDVAALARDFPEQEVLIQSVCETVVPKLVADDIPLLHSLLSDVFPGVERVAVDLDALKKEIRAECERRDFLCESAWLEKVIQLYQIQCLHHGVMMVGPSGSGKSSAWTVLLQALENLEGREGCSYIIDPKAMSKELLYGSLDVTTREWSDGLFTHILRRVLDNVRGEENKRHWIVFDGDVDPEWVENLNSVLDDNKMLTLPNGERLALPSNVRVMFEVQDLRYATLATVSRCGMVWFSEETLSPQAMFEWYLTRLRGYALDDADTFDVTKRPRRVPSDDSSSSTMQVQRDAAEVFAPLFLAPGSLVTQALDKAAELVHIMEFTRLRCLNALFSMLNQSVLQVLAYNQAHPDFPMEHDQLEQYLSKRMVYSLIWCFAGDGTLRQRRLLGEYIRGITTIQVPLHYPAPADVSCGRFP